MIMKEFESVNFDRKLAMSLTKLNKLEELHLAAVYTQDNPKTDMAIRKMKDIR